MKEYRIKKVTGAPNWRALDTLAIDVPYLESPSCYRSFAQVAYDEERLYVHLFCEEPVTRAVESGPLGSPCEDCCLEFFFAPMAGDPRYFNIEFNRNGCVYLGFAADLSSLVRLLPEEGDLLRPHIAPTEGGWEIFYTVPFRFIRLFFPDFSPAPGGEMRANCFKCADLTEPPHYFSWNPVRADGELSYHRPECFGRMLFD